MTASVGVIIPSFNHAHCISSAVGSVLAQTHSDWEAVIVDDGSTDNTRETVAEFTDSRIRYFYQENRGLSAARNTGIRIAHGRYLAFLDADDEWAPPFLERCVHVLENEIDAAAVVTLAQFIDENGIELPRMGGQTIQPESFRDRLIEGGFFPPNAIVVRASAVRDAGLFDELLTSVEDWDLWLRITRHGGLFLSIPEPLARYRISTGSMSTNAGRMHANRMAVLAKHFGLPEGDPLSWPSEKRRGYAFACRAAAYGYIAQQEVEQGWCCLAQAVKIEPGLLQRLDTFYELALGDQPRGYRGRVDSLDIELAGIEMEQRLEHLFAAGDVSLRPWRGVAFGKAFLALAMLSDQAGDWAAARRWLLKGIRSYPALLGEPLIGRRLLKLCLGQRVVGGLQRLRPRPKTQGAA